MTQMLIATIGIMVLITQPLVTFSIGIETGGPQFRALKPALGFRYFLATFVVMPALAILLGVLMLPGALWSGLALMSMAPPAPPATRQLKKRGNLDVGLAWQAIAFLIAVVTIPATIAIVERLGLVSQDLNLTWGQMLGRSALFFAGPMLLGLVTRRYLPAVADALAKPVGVAANVALAVLVLLILVVAVPVIWRFGIASIAIVAAFVAIAIVVGHLLGGPGRDTRVTLAAMLAARFPVPALVLAQANGATKAILPVVLVYIIAGAILVPLYDRSTR
ncbi:MAG TPA: hypothetical protein VMU38_06275 [Candidatus Binatia bacterium]|nr:hypothetical protein [Candidatus Binatia bacterium]